MEHLSPENIQRLIDGGEDVTLELKPEKESLGDIGELLIAMANAQGGTIIVGVRNDGTVVGVSKPKEVTDRIFLAARRANPPLIHHVSVDTIELKGKQLVIATLPQLTDAIYSYSGAFRKRHGSSNISMSPDSIRELVLQRNTSYDRYLLRGRSLADLDDLLINQLIEGRVRMGGLVDMAEPILPEPYPSTSAIEFLASVGAIEQLDSGWSPTVAGLLMLGKKPQQELPEATIQCARFKDTTAVEFIDRVELYGPLPHQLQAALAFVRRNTQLASRIVGLEREDVPEYPYMAVREALVNALMHRDWAVAGKVNLNIFSDRIEIINPGGLMPGLQADRLEGLHRTRNRTVAPLMLWMRLAETYGTGIRRMKAAMQSAGLPEPFIESSEAGLRLVLYSQQPNTDDHAGLITQTPQISLNLRQQMLLDRLAETEGRSTSRAEYASTYSISSTQAITDLSQLVKQGLLNKLGRSSATLYVLPDEPLSGMEE